ncbi:hypothetical protein [Mycobacterium malmoense]|uniref:hypothetical protein n=1 Tax=Mycobacterium malmoense TaxID=1780 RepID=UPI0008F849E1|nr:hypothetical protein [Mycobacterium malmoense]OIN81644.1 hypothetical protein BMG05_06485 [Mycobacterium malmoense]
MPDRDAEILDAQRAEREHHYDAGIAEWHREHHDNDTPHLTQAAIDDCGLCDPDGYRPSGVVCDHIDRTSIAAAGAARVRAALAKGTP